MRHHSLILPALLLLGIAAAQETLYAPAPPAGSAFVRVANADAATAVTLDGKATFRPGAQAVSAYVVVPQGAHTFRAGSATLRVNVAGGQYQTLVLQGGKLRALDAELPGTVTRARLTLYNFSDAPASLMTADGRTRLLTDVPAGSVKSLSVNAVSAALGVFAADKPVQTFPTEALRAGASYSAFVFGAHADRTAVFVTPGK
ncbi:alginate O-acetyltransferase complex protein AlgF [Deinococcus metalli]|uniref:Alginate biosynthesis protein AlgF n=1 Tax=Deinococcus metalli TaxID=1141878 RepID=A0A7W8NNE0_9DEIO|nr:alginate O-acetyltransferase AlgF [Deinococcus metalli]MBB5375651.1 alginate O-acetyltransferase complex protein AlgF [Deinococcus metalli]GHF38073.1 hypothetical protein GCM10017781_13500 [Deinococcus metalli]